MVPAFHPNVLWSALFSALPDVMMLVDAQGNIVEINHTLAPLTREQTLGTNISLYVPPTSVPRVETALHAAFTRNEPSQYEVDYVGPDGSRGWFFVRVAPVVIDGQVALASFLAQDITARRALEIRTRKLAAIVERSGEALVMVNSEGRIEDWNPASEALLGYPAEEIVGQPVAVLIPPDRLHEGKAMQEALAKGLSPSLRTVRVAKDGRHVHVLLSVVPVFGDDGSPLGTCAMLRDITEQQLEAEALRHSNVALARERAQAEQMLSNLLEGLPDGVVVSRNAIFLYANPAFLRMAERDMPSLLGMSVTEFLEPHQHASTLTQLQRSEAGETSRLRKAVMVTGSGKRISIEVVSEPVQFHGEPAVLTVVRDISEREVLEEKLLRAQRMEAVGRVASGVAHEINNALFIISANLELSLATLQDDPATRELIEAAIEGTERSSTVVRGLLDYSRQEPDAEKQRCAAHALLSKSLNAYRHLCGSEIEVQLELDASEDIIAVRDVRLEQIVTNVVLNATSAMQRRGRIRMATCNREGADGRLRFILDIADSGPGIREDVQQRMFEPFFTTKASGEGTGLGLAVVSAILERSGGEVRVDSRLGEGTIFRFSWPVAAARASSNRPNIANAAQQLDPTHSRRRKVLVVDDEEQIRNLMVRMLTAAGYEVQAVTSAEQALQMLASNDGFDLLLSDDRMSGMSGTELICQLHDSHPKLPTILLTGMAPKPDESPAGLRILHKPVGRSALLEAVQAALASH